MDRDSIIRSYVERITALEASRREALTAGDLHDLARDLGMSDDDLAAADAARRAHLERGRGHARYRQWDDAIRELREALAFEPMDVETLHALALAYRDRWRERGYSADREEAGALSHRVLEIDPRHEESFVLLGEIDPRPPIADPTRGRFLRVIFSLAAIIAVGLGLLMLQNMRRDPDRPAVETAIGSARQRVEIERMPVDEFVEADGIPVELVETARSAGLSLSPISSVFAADSYALVGRISSTVPFEVVALKCELLDSAGELIKSENISVAAPHDMSKGVEFRIASAGLPRRVEHVRLWVSSLTRR
jgi:tetratricopeptide (TPR) repeat protein